MRKYTILLFAGLLAALLFTSCTKDPGPIAWEPEMVAAMEKAEAQKKPVFLLFSSSTCPHCRKMKEEIFTTKRFHVAGQAFVAAEVSTTPENQSVYEIYSVKNIPTILLLSPSGQEYHRFVGEQTENTIITAMEDSVRRAGR